MLLEENGFVEKETSSESPCRNGSSSNGTGRRRRPPPADFVPFDTSESTNVRRRNGGSVNNSEKKKSDILSLEKPVLMDWKDIPEHLRFNKYVLGHYRPATNWIGCIKSLLYFHNETINILTHAIPIFAIGCCIPSFLPYDEITVPYLPTFHIIASMAPWLGSTLYHLFMCHHDGVHIYKKLLALDMLGIWVTQVTGGLVTICATIYCLSPEVQRRFLICYAFLCVYCLYKAMTAQCPWSRRFSFTTPFLVRMAMVFLRAVGLGAGHPDSFPHVILQDAIAVTGAFVGVSNIPERWFPGTLDLFFNSHHLMHVLVVYAVYEMHKATSLDLAWMSQVNANATECPNPMGEMWQDWSAQVWA